MALATAAFGAVNARGVDEVDAEIERRRNDAARLRLVAAIRHAEPAVAAAAETDDADRESGATEPHRLHESLLSNWHDDTGASSLQFAAGCYARAPRSGASHEDRSLPRSTDASCPSPISRAPIEERGFDSIWVPEHSHIPTTGSTPYPGRGPVTRDFARTLDPFVALTAAASVTHELKLGTGICLLIQRDTIHTAKTVATLDHLSGGRVLFGVGGGWNKPEMENHGTVYATRFQRLEEQLQALKTIWTEDEPEFHGEHVDFAPMWLWPKPVSQPHPPIFIGGETDHTLRRIAKYADGWLPRVRDPRLRARRHRRGCAHLRARKDAIRTASRSAHSASPAKPEAIAAVPRCRRRSRDRRASRRDRSTTCCGGSIAMRNCV